MASSSILTAMSATQALPLPTETAIVEIDEGYFRPVSSWPVQLGAIAFYAGLLAAVLFWMHYIVQHKSGISDPDSVHRIWSRASEIRRQPVKWPGAWAVLVSSGVTIALLNVAYGSLDLIGGCLNIWLQLQSFDITIVWHLMEFLATWLTAPLSVALYRIAGGQSWKLCALANLIFTSIEGGRDILYFAYLSQFHDPEKVKLDQETIYWLSHPVSLIIFLLFQAPLCVWAAYKTLPRPAQLIYNTAVIPNWVKLDRTIVVATIPLLLFEIADRVILFHTSFHEIAGFVFYFTRELVSISINALAAIISVNRALLAGEFQWHWRAFLTTAIPGAISALVMIAVFWRGAIYHRAVSFIVHTLVSSVLIAGGSGSLGAYAYIRVAERRSRLLVENRSE